MKSFYTRDFYAISQLKKYNIKVLILTQSFGKCMQIKLDNLIEKWKDHVTLITRIDDKLKFLVGYLLDNKIHWSEVAYMGDAENDFACMQRAAYTACPCDATENIREQSNFISDYPGGKGAVYDFIMYLIYNYIRRKE
jgi:3-deoxy-D-manno-octulosonate 8-phosphate phosphatase KdsC-like HAD superfamily phosphatase